MQFTSWETNTLLNSFKYTLQACENSSTFSLWISCYKKFNVKTCFFPDNAIYYFFIIYIYKNLKDIKIQSLVNLIKKYICILFWKTFKIYCTNFKHLITKQFNNRYSKKIQFEQLSYSFNKFTDEMFPWNLYGRFKGF